MTLIWIILGWISVILGVIGAVLPIMPTTPFLILAAYCFSKGSPRWHAWLLSRPGVGPILADWEKNRSIPLRVKKLATVMIGISFLVSSLFFPGLWLWKVLFMLLGVGVIVFIWTRRSN